MTVVFRIITPKLRKLAVQSAYLPRALALVWTAAARWTTAWVVLLIVQGLLPVATVYLTRSLVNRLIAALRGGGAWQPVLVLAGTMGVIMLLAELLRTAAGWVRTAQAELVQDYISSLIHQKSATVISRFTIRPTSMTISTAPGRTPPIVPSHCWKASGDWCKTGLPWPRCLRF